MPKHEIDHIYLVPDGGIWRAAVHCKCSRTSLVMGPEADDAIRTALDTYNEHLEKVEADNAHPS